jgi:uncharacterized protein
MRKTIFSFILIAILCESLIVMGAEIPYLTGRVTDNAQILSEETRHFLSESLKDHEVRTTNQIAILTIPSLDGDNIEDFASRVFKEWKLGQKDKNNGILIIVVPDDKKMRIEVGYGLEATLTDLMAGRIIRNIMTPNFKNGNFDRGLKDGALAVIEILEGSNAEEVTGTGEDNISSTGNGLFDMKDSGLSIMERILIGAFIFGIIGIFTLLGIVTPGFGWFLYLFLIPFWAMFPIIVVGTKGAFIIFIIYLIAFPIAKLILKNSQWYKNAQTDIRTKGKASIGGFVFSSGGSGGSWSSGSSSSEGSSYSGGGGSSGGGGASGGW